VEVNEERIRRRERRTRRLEARQVFERIANVHFKLGLACGFFFWILLSLPITSRHQAVFPGQWVVLGVFFSAHLIGARKDVALINRSRLVTLQEGEYPRYQKCVDCGDLTDRSPRCPYCSIDQFGDLCHLLGNVLPWVAPVMILLGWTPKLVMVKLAGQPLADIGLFICLLGPCAAWVISCMALQPWSKNCSQPGELEDESLSTEDPALETRG